MKPILIKNIGQLNVKLAEEFVKRHMLFNSTVLLTPDAFTPTVAEFCAKYMMNVLMQFGGTTELFNSVEESANRCNGLLERIAAYPSNKFSYVYVTDNGPAPEGVLSLALEYVDRPVLVVRADDHYDAFFALRDSVMQFQNSTGEELPNIDYVFDFSTRYDVLDFDVLSRFMLSQTEAIDVKLI